MASNVQVYLSIINLGEIAYILERNYGAEEANQTIADIRQLPITIVQAGENRVMAAARLKANYRMSYADAFAAAAAEEMQAILITGDPELISLQGIIQVEALEREKKA
jgi:ribonuclease VapC